MCPVPNDSTGLFIFLKRRVTSSHLRWTKGARDADAPDSAGNLFYTSEKRVDCEIWTFRHGGPISNGDHLAWWLSWDYHNLAANKKFRAEAPDCTALHFTALGIWDPTGATQISSLLQNIAC
jgi:hypothetical protein